MAEQTKGSAATLSRRVAMLPLPVARQSSVFLSWFGFVKHSSVIQSFSLSVIIAECRERTDHCTCELEFGEHLWPQPGHNIHDQLARRSAASLQHVNCRVPGPSNFRLRFLTVTVGKPTATLQLPTWHPACAHRVRDAERVKRGRRTVELRIDSRHRRREGRSPKARIMCHR